jgi:ATP/maltotriose-dependent transcriptional regulator MalT
MRLTRRQSLKNFEKNTAAIEALGITQREYHVLERLAIGDSNKQIARRLSVSPNTIKTHLANLYAKLEVKKRAQAVQAARQLGLIP